MFVRFGSTDLENSQHARNFLKNCSEWGLENETYDLRNILEHVYGAYYELDSSYVLLIRLPVQWPIYRVA
jgi:hypothetical protein